VANLTVDIRGPKENPSCVMSREGRSMKTYEETTCGPAYIDDPRRLEEEIVTALKKQGYRITKNAIGDNCVAGFVNIARLAEALRRVVVRITMMDSLQREDF
jgi:hypothetical protein